MAKYKVLAGKYVRGRGEDQEIFGSGVVFEDPNPKLHLHYGMTNKLQKIASDENPVQDNRDDDLERIDAMNLPQLHAYAQANNIDLGNASKKADIKKLILDYTKNGPAKVDKTDESEETAG